MGAPPPERLAGLYPSLGALETPPSCYSFSNKLFSCRYLPEELLLRVILINLLPATMPSLKSGITIKTLRSHFFPQPVEGSPSQDRLLSNHYGDSEKDELETTSCLECNKRTAGGSPPTSGRPQCFSLFFFALFNIAAVVLIWGAIRDLRDDNNPETFFPKRMTPRSPSHNSMLTSPSPHSPPRPPHIPRPAPRGPPLPHVHSRLVLRPPPRQRLRLHRRSHPLQPPSRRNIFEKSRQYIRSDMDAPVSLPANATYLNRRCRH